MSDVSGCLSKKRYGEERLAKQIGAAIWFERRVALRVYACTECGGYHLTKSNAKPPTGRNFGPPRRPKIERNDRKRRRGRR